MAAREAHRTAATTVAYRDRFEPLLVGPLEIRENIGYSIAGPQAAGSSDAVYRGR